MLQCSDFLLRLEISGLLNRFAGRLPVVDGGVDSRHGLLCSLKEGAVGLDVGLLNEAVLGFCA